MQLVRFGLSQRDGDTEIKQKCIHKTARSAAIYNQLYLAGSDRPGLSNGQLLTAAQLTLTKHLSVNSLLFSFRPVAFLFCPPASTATFAFTLLLMLLTMPVTFYLRRKQLVPAIELGTFQLDSNYH